MEDCANATQAIDDRESNNTVHEQGDVLKNEAGGDAKTTGIPKRKPAVPQHPTATPHKNPPQYLSLLLDEKRGLGSLPNALDFKHLSRLVDEEISKVRVGLGQPPLQSQTQPKGCGDATTPKSGGPRVVLQEKVFVPVHDFPDYNFVGRILGPRGMTAKQLEEETGCRIMIRGRGSTRDEESTSGGPKDELHVLIQCEDSQETAQAKMKHAVECVRLMLKPPPEGEDELKRHQLMQLAIINGTYRPTNNLKLNGSNQSALAQMQMCGYHPNASNNSSIPSGNTNEDTKSFPFNTAVGSNLTPIRGAASQSNDATDTPKRYVRSGGANMNMGNTAQTSPIVGSHMLDQLTAAAAYSPQVASALLNGLVQNPSLLASQYYKQIISGMNLCQAVSNEGMSITPNNTIAPTTSSANFPVRAINLQGYLTAASMLNNAPLSRVLPH